MSDLNNIRKLIVEQDSKLKKSIIEFINKPKLYKTENGLAKNNKCINFENNKLDKLNKKYTFLMIGEFIDFEFINHVKNKNNIFIKIKEDNAIDYEKIYLDDDNIKNYVVTKNKIRYMIEYCFRKYENAILVFNDIKKLDLLLEFKEKIKIVYYQNTNYYTSIEDFFNRNINLFLEKECCNQADIIVTNNIYFYNYKNIVERRKNIYFINKNINDDMVLDCVISDCYNIENLRNYTNNMNEYDKILYHIGLSENDMNKRETLAEYLYNKYLTKESYDIYVAILLLNKKYKKIIEVSLYNKFCKKIYVEEMLYLYSFNELNLLEFIINISLNNFTLADVTSNNYLEYRLCVLNFEGNKYSESYKKYMNFLRSDNIMLKSPMTMRNISYLMYMHQNSDYKIYYNNYKKISSNI